MESGPKKCLSHTADGTLVDWLNAIRTAEFSWGRDVTEWTFGYNKLNIL